MWLFIRTRRPALFEVDTAGGENKDGGREGGEKKILHQSSNRAISHVLCIPLFSIGISVTGTTTEAVGSCFGIIHNFIFPLFFF